MIEFKIRRLKSSKNIWFKEFWKIYSESFPLIERRDYEQQVAVLSNPVNICDLYFTENQLVGFISHWETDEFIFIEHLAISADFQRKGLGTALLKPFIECQSVPVILEIEPPKDPITSRRVQFYESVGFVINPHIHFQPRYHLGDEPLLLNILSYPTQISKQRYNRFSQFQKRTMKLS